MAPILHVFRGIKRCVQYLASCPHKPIFYPSNYYDGSNVIRLIWSGNKVEYYTTHNCLECHQYSDSRITNRRRSVSDIIHNLIGFSVFWKLHIQPTIASDSTDGEIGCIYKADKKNKFIRRYMEALALHTDEPTVHWAYNTSYISVVESKIVTPIVKHIDITVCFIL